MQAQLPQIYTGAQLAKGEQRLIFPSRKSAFKILAPLLSSGERVRKLPSATASTIAKPSLTSEPATLRRWVTEGHQRSTASSRVSASALIPVPVRETVAEEEMLMPMPKDVENLADDPQLHNPLQRSERMSTGWFGVVMEYDGVVVEDTSHLQRMAWQKVAEEEGRSVPPLFLLQRAEGMKNDQVIKEVLCWTREVMEVRRIAERKEVVLSEMLGDNQPLLAPDLPSFLEGLSSSKVPAALATSVPEARVKPAIEALGLEGAFAGIVAAEDTFRGRPDPEPYLLAAQMLGRPPARCVVVGNSNQTVEAAKECGMASVVVAGRKPLYELGAADLVIKRLSELRVINLQQLFRNEELVTPNEPVPQMELEEEDSYEGTENW